MSLNNDLMLALDMDEVESFQITKDVIFHGERAIAIDVELKIGKTVEGIFTNQPKDGFGGIQFENRKDISALMRAKVISVLDGTADEN